ncbi:MAG: hypothetical protein DCC75_00880 [Proteobacteria bacterium]|nr:MAG: hypothetical protein DCC75_00880 [Pseudomonadota bacterium]
MLLPLTGEFGFFGDQVRKGAELALKGFRDEGREIELHFEDDQCLPRFAVEGFQRHRTVNNVQAVIGPGCTGGILAVAPLAKQANLPVLALLDANREVERAGGVAVLGFSSEREPELIADEMNKQGLKTAAMICETDAWAELVCSTFRAKWQALGGSLVADELQRIDDRDYRPVIRRALGRKPQAIYFVPAYNGGVFLKQLRELNTKIPVFGPDTFGTKEVIDAAGGAAAAEGTIYAGVDLRPDKPSQREWIAAFKSAYGSEPSSLYYAALGYDALRIAVRALDSGKDWSSALKAMAYDDGVLPDVRFDDSLMARIEPVLLRIAGGNFVRYPGG